MLLWDKLVRYTFTSLAAIAGFLGYEGASSVPKGLVKLGNIVADANVSQFSRAGNMCCGNKFCCSETKNVFAMESKTFLLPGHKFCVQNICFPV